MNTNKKIYKNYRNKFSSPLISKLEQNEIFRNNPRLIARVTKFLGYIVYRQLNNKKKCRVVKIGERQLKSREKKLRFQNLDQLYLNFYSSISHFNYVKQSKSHIFLPYSSFIPINTSPFPPSNFSSSFTSSVLYTPNTPPIYSTENGTKEVNKEPYLLTLTFFHWKEREKILGEKYYAEATRVLIEMGIIYSDLTRKAGKKTYAYALTEYGSTLLNSSHREYIYKKIYGKEKRNRQRRLKRSGYYDIHYADPILQNAKDVIDGIQNFDELYNIAEKLKSSKATAATHLIDSLIEKNYKRFKIHKNTGRFYSPIHMLPKEVKRAMVIKGKSLAGTIDVRSCHPTLLGLWVRELADTPSEELEREITQYNRLFCDPDNHPRKIIQQDIKTDFEREFDMDEIKKGLNTFINGSRGNLKERNPAKYLRRWLEQNFPTIFQYWVNSKIKQTGNNIAKRWERDIFRRPEVLNKATELGLIIMDNHDELLIYGSVPKAKQLISWFKKRAQSVSGLNVQFSAKIAA